MKSIFITLSLILFVSCAKKEDADINKIVSDAYPNVSIESLKKIDENFHEIIINNQIYYATNDGKYLIVGSVIDLDTKESITENTKMEQRLKVINSIDQSYQVIYKPDKTDYVLTIFTDASCPYCQKLHNELSGLLENNIEVRYVLFSRNGKDVDAYEQLVSAWCAENRLEAIDSIFQGDLIDDNTTCINPLDRNFEYASALSVEGTPTIFLEDGRIIPGYQSYEKIIAFIKN